MSDTSSRQLSPGPFPYRAEDDASGAHEEGPLRHLECACYERCLALAAALDWESFDCDGCSQEINDVLVWRAAQSTRKDKVARAICGSHQIRTIESTTSKKG